MSLCIALGQLQRAEVQGISSSYSMHWRITHLLCYSVGVCSVLLRLFLEDGGCGGSLLKHPFERGGLQSFPLKAWGETSTSNIVPISDTNGETRVGDHGSRCV